MSAMILITPITLIVNGMPQFMVPGRTITDPTLQAVIVTNGGVLAPASDPTIAAAAKVAVAMKLRGAESLMVAALAVASYASTQGGGGGGGVASVTAGDSTITIGGTIVNPTVAVNAIAESQVTGLVGDLSTLTVAAAAAQSTADTALTEAGAALTGLTGDVLATGPGSATSVVASITGVGNAVTSPGPLFWDVTGDLYLVPLGALSLGGGDVYVPGGQIHINPTSSPAAVVVGTATMGGDGTTVGLLFRSGFNGAIGIYAGDGDGTTNAITINTPSVDGGPITVQADNEYVRLISNNSFIDVNAGSGVNIVGDFNPVQITTLYGPIAISADHGDVSIRTNDASGEGTHGIAIKPGTALDSGYGAGTVQISGGDASTSGGGVSVNGGSGDIGGAVSLNGGTSGAGDAPGIGLYGGDGDSLGGPVSLTGGNAGVNGGSGPGGNVNFFGGSGSFGAGGSIVAVSGLGDFGPNGQISATDHYYTLLLDGVGNASLSAFAEASLALSYTGTASLFDGLGEAVELSANAVRMAESTGAAIKVDSGDCYIQPASGGATHFLGHALGFFSTLPVTQQTVGALTNNVTAGGTTGTIANFTSLTVYATDAAAIRNNIYQLALELSNLRDAMHSYGLC